MARVQCPEHGLVGGLLVSHALIARYGASQGISPNEIGKVEVAGGAGTIAEIWSDLASLVAIGIPASTSLSMDDFLEAGQRLKCQPVCPDCARRWLRKNNIDPRDIELG